MNLMERFADPMLISDLTITEKLAGAGITTVMGMGVTFLVLFLLWGRIALMSHAMSRVQKLPSEGTVRSTTSKSTTADTPVSPSQGELIAVIAAAAQACCDSDSTINRSVSIRQIRRPGGEDWSRAGRWENMR